MRVSNSPVSKGGITVCGIIPARGGSKGIPRKNLKLLRGKPLIYYAIVESLRSRYVSKTIVSAEDEEIAEISRRYGVEIIKKGSSLFCMGKLIY